MPKSGSVASECIHHVSRIQRMMQFYDKCRSSFEDMTFLQMQLLLYVMDNKEVTMKDLATYFKVRPASMTPLIDRLVGRGMLVRTQDTKDRRVTKVSLTEKAGESLGRIFEERAKAMEFILAFLEEEDRQALLRIMQTIESGLSAHFEKA